MERYAGLDVSMEETHIRVLDREGRLVREGKTRASPAAIATFLAAGPPCNQVVFETGRMAPMHYHGLAEHGVRVMCIESRQAYHALKSLAGHKTDRNDARGVAYLARTGFYKQTHVKSLIGAAFRDLAIPVGEVWASPFARCVDHARISFGRVHEDMRLIGLLSDDAGRAERTRFLRRLVISPPETGSNRVIVAHRSNIAAVADIALREGEAVVLQPDGRGGFAAIGTMMPDEWAM